LPTVEELENELRRELRFLTPPEGKATIKRSLQVAPKAAPGLKKTASKKSKRNAE